jgi:hypothetical protein
MKECKTCLFTEDIAKFDNEGICDYCRLQEQQSKNTNPDDWPILLNEIKEKGVNKQYDCLIGISGGEDSSVLLYLAVKVWKLRPLVIHFNNRTNRPVADRNIRTLIDHLNVNFIEFFLDKQEYDNLTDSLLMAGVPDADIANDVCMSKIQVKTALDYGIKYILNGHSFREEGSSPKAWSVIDTTYLNDVYRKFNQKNLVNYPLLTLWDQIYSALRGLQKISPFHYHHHNRPQIIQALKSIGWEDYGGKHNENIYTAFVGNELLPKKHGIDKRRTYLSAQIREGKMTKFQAQDILAKPAFFDTNDLGERKEHILRLARSPIGKRSDYKQTNYKLYRPLFWLLMKLGVVPASMYKKYCL